MSKKIEDGMVKTSDGIDIFMTRNLADSPKAIIIIVHGICEHLGRYNDTTSRFNEWGYSVYRFDLRGHGRSGGDRGYVESYERFIDDTDLIVNTARQENPGLPIFLLGHSMGGFISVAYGIKHQDRLSGLIHSGSAVMILPMVKDLGEGFEYNAMALTPIPNSLSNLISHDPEVVKAYDDDPLVLKEFTMKLMGEIFIRGVNWVLKNMGSYRYPCLILHGGDDQIVPSEASRNLYDQIASTDKQIKIYDGLYHEILNEPEKETVLADIHQWIEARI
jgi:alpha-beta hydrolase superfamily lysophospholipase